MEGGFGVPLGLSLSGAYQLHEKLPKSRVTVNAAVSALFQSMKALVTMAHRIQNSRPLLMVHSLSVIEAASEKSKERQP